MSKKTFPISFDFERVLRTLAKEIYDTPMAFLRENVQNAVDALRLLLIDNPNGEGGRIDIRIDGDLAVIRDNGIGMSEYELQNLFWKIGASGKNTPEARRAGCIGTFGIGGFANFGVCRKLTVTSKKSGSAGCCTGLSKDDFKESTPHVTCVMSEDAAPHGTIIEAELEGVPNVDELKDYIKTFVRYVPESIFFNGDKVSGEKFVEDESLSKFSEISHDVENLSIGGSGRVSAKYFKDEGGTVIVRIDNAQLDDMPIECKGLLRLHKGTIEVFKRGFKLCNINVSSSTGITGKINSDAMQPTAGRDSLSAESQQFVNAICKSIEQRAIELILESRELLAQHTRILGQVVRGGIVEGLGNMDVTLADGTKITLEELRKFSESGMRVYFGSRVDKELLDVLQAAGNLIIILSADRNRRLAEETYLARFCGGASYESLVEIREIYKDLSTFEIEFLTNLEMTIRLRYEVYDFKVVSAAITGGVPVCLKGKQNGKVKIYVDVRHKEIERLRPLEGSPLLYSMATEFCKEYLGNALKAKSPKFFGSGAMDFDELIKRRAEVWKLVEADVFTEIKGVDLTDSGTREAYRRNRAGIQETFVSTDIKSVEVGEVTAPENDTGEEAADCDKKRTPKILRIIDKSGDVGIDGYYFKLMEGPAKAFGNDIQAMDESSLFWFGNRITYAFTDLQEVAFHYELRLQEIILVEMEGAKIDTGALVELDRPIQEYQGGMFLPIPRELEQYLVPTPQKEVLIRVNYDWFDLRRGRVWPL